MSSSTRWCTASRPMVLHTCSEVCLQCWMLITRRCCVLFTISHVYCHMTLVVLFTPKLCLNLYRCCVLLRYLLAGGTSTVHCLYLGNFPNLVNRWAYNWCAMYLSPVLFVFLYPQHFLHER